MSLSCDICGGKGETDGVIRHRLSIRPDPADCADERGLKTVGLGSTLDVCQACRGPAQKAIVVLFGGFGTLVTSKIPDCDVAPGAFSKPRLFPYMSAPPAVAPTSTDDLRSTTSDQPSPTIEKKQAARAGRKPRKKGKQTRKKTN
jgi:hypothetical protein